MTTYCVFPKKAEFREFEPVAVTLPSAKAVLSKVGTAELHLTGEDTVGQAAAFEWVKQRIPNGETCGLICHAVVCAEPENDATSPSQIMRRWGCVVTSQVIDEKTRMVTGVYSPTTERSASA